MRRLAVAATAVAALAVAGCGDDDGPARTSGGVTLTGARIGEPAGENAALYFVIESDDADVVTAASTTAAASTMLHETVVEGGLSSMRTVEGGVELPAGEEVRFEPGGLHVMLLDVDPGLAVGDVVPFELELGSGATVASDAEVVPLTELSGE